MPIDIFFDGGCYISNPGAAAGAAVIISPTKERIVVSKFIPSATNNVAEYSGLIVGLEKALELNYKKVKVFGDSQLVINQVNGAYKVNLPHLRLLRDQAVKLKEQFSMYLICWIPREQNTLADAAATAAINQAIGLKPVSSAIAKTLTICAPVSGLETQINRLNQQGPHAKFKAFLELKVPGNRDQFSRMRYEKLKQQLSTEVYAVFDGAVGGDITLVTKAMRWYLRGLMPELAIRKIEVDAEVSANVSKKRV